MSKADQASDPNEATRDLPRTTGELKLDRSMAILVQARKLVPGVTQSLMKRPEMFCLGSFPVYLAGGQGALVRDVDGNEFIDYITGLGANTLGHNHPKLVAALHARIGDGLLHSLPTELEVDAARELVEMIPGAEMTRFFKTGADATSAAIRLARHVTNKEHIITVGYNGWHDHFMFDTPGVPAAFKEYTTRLPLQLQEQEAAVFELIESKATKLAAIILSLPYNRCVSADFMRNLREACSKHGVIFIMDEVVTGFRLARGGAQEFYDVSADLVCLSKGIAAGMPLSAVTGRRETMLRMDELQVSTTFGGELLSLEACRVALAEYRETDHIARINKLGRRLREAVNAHSEAKGYPLRIRGYDAIPFFMFAPQMDLHVKLAIPFVGAMAKRSVILRRDVNFISGAHTEAQIEFTIRAVVDALDEMSQQGLFEAPKGA